MEIYERITTIIKKQNLTKREFAQRLISLEPKLRTTGEIPTEKTIYKYLNGAVAIRIELIPYMAQALNITEQELFLSSPQERINFYRKIVQNANDEELEIIKKRLLTKYKLDKVIKDYMQETDTQVTEGKKEQVIKLLAYAPASLLDSLLVKLEDIKQYTQEIGNI